MHYNNILFYTAAIILTDTEYGPSQELGIDDASWQNLVKELIRFCAE